MTQTLITMALVLGLAPAHSAPATPEVDLVAALQDQDPDIRALAAALLVEDSETSRNDATEALRGRLSDRNENWRVRVAAAEALAEGRGGEAEVTAGLVTLVLDRSEDWRVRAAALSAARLRDGGLLLSQALTGRDEVRISNGRTSVSLTSPLADSSIFDALTDPDPRMRLLARTALDSGIELAQSNSLPTSVPCFSEVLQQVLGQASSATGALTLY